MCVGCFTTSDDVSVAIGCESGAVYLMEDFALSQHLVLDTPVTRLVAYRAPHEPAVHSLICCTQSNVLQIFTRGQVRIDSSLYCCTLCSSLRVM